MTPNPMMSSTVKNGNEQKNGERVIKGNAVQSATVLGICSIILLCAGQGPAAKW
jgi:hypothetical protein